MIIVVVFAATAIVFLSTFTLTEKNSKKATTTIIRILTTKMNIEKNGKERVMFTSISFFNTIFIFVQNLNTGSGLIFVAVIVVFVIKKPVIFVKINLHIESQHV